jgi:hypothetical protein
MLPPTDGKAEDLCMEAVRRWKQLWTLGNVRTSYDSIDDVSVAILDNTFAAPPSVCIPYSLNCFDASHIRNAFPFDIRRIDEVVIGDHKAFFLHFNIIDHELRKLLRNIRDRNVKLYYNDLWFWHLKLRGTFTILEQTFLHSHADLNDLDDYIPYMTWVRMNDFITTFLSS